MERLRKFEPFIVAGVVALAVAASFWPEIAGLWRSDSLPFYLPVAFIYFFIPWLLYQWARELWPRQRFILPFSALGALIFVKFLCPGLPELLISLPRAKELVLSLLHSFFGKTIPLPAVRVGIPALWLLLPLLAAVGYRKAVRQGRKEAARLLSVKTAVTGIILLGLVARWEALAIAAHLPLDPDAVVYRQIADDMQHLYDTKFREPLWIWVIKLWFLIFGSSDLHLRILSVFLSVFLLVAAWQFIYRLTGHAGISLLTLTILAAHPYLILMSVRGLRLELYTIALLILAFYTFVGDPCISPRARILGLTIGGTLTILQQLNSFTFVPFFWLYAFWRYRLPWLYLLAPASAAAALVAPYLIYCARTFGDPLWSINVHAIWYRNYELMVVKKTGCAWYRSLAEFEKNAYLGPKITTFEYIFKMHSLKEVVLRLAEGYGKLFLYPNRYFWLQIGVKSLLAYLVYIAGLLKLLASRYRSVLLYPLLTINMLAFLVPINIDPRLVAHTTPVTAWIFASGLWLCGVEFPRWIKSRMRQERQKLAKNFLSRKG